jgi:hypothetical protein
MLYKQNEELIDNLENILISHQTSINEKKNLSMNRLFLIFICNREVT